jgi:hypothetical protein
MITQYVPFKSSKKDRDFNKTIEYETEQLNRLEAYKQGPTKLIEEQLLPPSYRRKLFEQKTDFEHLDLPEYMKNILLNLDEQRQINNRKNHLIL